MATGSAPDPDFEVIRRAWAAQSERNEERIFRAALHPAIEAVPLGAEIADRSYQGPDRVMHWWRTRAARELGGVRDDPEHFRRVGARILVTGRWHARGRQSGVELDSPAALDHGGAGRPDRLLGDVHGRRWAEREVERDP